MASSVLTKVSAVASDVMRRLTGFLCCIVVATACQQPVVVVDDTVALPTVTTAPAVDPTPGTTADVISETDLSGCFDDDPPLVDDGFLGRFESSDSDSQALTAVNWSDSGECAAVTLSFRTEAGAPAVDPPEFRAEYLRHTAVVRVELGQGVSGSAISDQALDTALLNAAYVAYDSAADGLVVDIHLAAGAVVRARSASAPARIILEMEDDGTPVDGAAVSGSAVLVFALASSNPPLIVQGYGRSGIEISASLVASSSSIEDTIFLAESPTRWTAFEWSVREFQPGPVAIRMGDAPTIEFLSQ
jgi:hypothetical protein